MLHTRHFRKGGGNVWRTCAGSGTKEAVHGMQMPRVTKQPCLSGLAEMSDCLHGCVLPLNRVLQLVARPPRA